jgi:membrane associated rhomboid family serine protease
MFIHGSFTHILFNMLYLLVFGDNVEDRLGGPRFLALYFISGMAAVALQVVIDPGSWIPTIGASGAIAGVLSAYLILSRREKSAFSFSPVRYRVSEGRLRSFF